MLIFIVLPLLAVEYGVICIVFSQKMRLYQHRLFFEFIIVRELIPLLLLTVVISSCEKLETPENVKGQIRFVKSGASENKGHDEEYLYHSDGTLREKIEYKNDTVNKFHIYEFTNDKKLKSIRSFKKDTILISETFFEFNNSGLLIRETYFNSLYQQHFGYNGYGVYKYYENNLLSKASFYDKNGELMHYYTYEDYKRNKVVRFQSLHLLSLKPNNSLKPTDSRVTPFAQKAKLAPRYGGLVPPLCQEK